MSERYLGGFITKTPVEPTTTSASGVWTLDQQMQYEKANSWPYGGTVTYVEDVFNTTLYTGTGVAQTITNGINLSTYGGMVWLKGRNNIQSSGLFDTARTNGGLEFLSSDLTGAATNDNGGTMLFNSNGFTRSASSYFGGTGSGNGNYYTAWTFREQPKFFDIVTYTGNGIAGRQISHNLQAAPGFMIIKRVDASSNWPTYHVSVGPTKTTYLNLSDATYTHGTAHWNDTAPTDLVFTVGNDTDVNGSGGTYVAYLYANNAGGFGLSGNDSIIACGSYTGNNGNPQQVEVGFEPQFLFVKNASLGTAGAWWSMVDTQRSMTPLSGNQISVLKANTTGAEIIENGFSPYATGFNVSNNNDFQNNLTDTYLYVAIRRGPMKVPTTGTSVFQPITYTGTNVDNRLVTTNIVTDMVMARVRNTTSAGGFLFADRMRANFFAKSVGATAWGNDTDSFMTTTTGYGYSFTPINGFGVGNDPTQILNGASTQQLAYALQRAPTFFDIVNYVGTGFTGQGYAHNLGTVPQMMIIKSQSAYAWGVYVDAIGNGNYLALNTTAAAAAGATYWNSTTPTATTFYVGSAPGVNASAVNNVAYLFATCPGVSKVGAYLGTGVTQTIDCGFSAGARFLLVKRVDSTGNWYVFDSARGYNGGVNAYLLFDTTAAEVTGANLVDTATAGFQVVTTGALNVSGATYIYLAIA